MTENTSEGSNVPVGLPVERGLPEAPENVGQMNQWDEEKNPKTHQTPPQPTTPFEPRNFPKSNGVPVSDES